MQKFLIGFIIICFGWGFTLITTAIDLSGCYKKVFKVSAYYSPVPNQKFYYKGNYLAEIRLNGKGVRGASGKLVFNGMLAAPKSYKFGTKIYFPDLEGVGQVEDRGQAIVHKGERNQSYDRIDIWVGKGDKALMRALSFGKKTLVGYVCPGTKSLKVGFDFNKFPLYSNFFEKTFWGIGLYLGRKDQWVTILQTYLKKLGYFNYRITGYFGYITKNAVIKFQKDNGIITNYWGYFGPKTRKKLKQILINLNLLHVKKSNSNSILVSSPHDDKIEHIKKELSILKRGLGKGYHTYEVKILQKYLKILGYYNGKITGYYDNRTFQAVKQFQLDNGIVSHSYLYAAGWFGPKTRKLFKELVLNKIKE